MRAIPEPVSASTKKSKQESLLFDLFPAPILVVGKMEGEKQEVVDIYEFLRSDFYGQKRTIPVASGGLHPGLVDDLMEIFGTDFVIQAGGGVHGHPDGTRSGAKAMKQAVEASMKGIGLEWVERAEGRDSTSITFDLCCGR